MEVDSPDIKKVTENIQDVLDSNMDSSESKKSENSLEKPSTTTIYPKNISSVKKELIFDSPREPDLEPKSQEEGKPQQFAAPSGGQLIIEPNQNNLKKSENESPFWDLEKMRNNLKKPEVESPFLDLEKIETVKRELKFDMAEPEPEVEPPKKPKIQQKEPPKAFDDLVKVA